MINAQWAIKTHTMKWDYKEKSASEVRKNRKRCPSVGGIQYDRRVGFSACVFGFGI